MRQSLQLAVGHEDDIAYFTILRTILYTPLRSQRVRRACVYLASPVIQKYADVIPLKYLSRALLHLQPPVARVFRVLPTPRDLRECRLRNVDTVESRIYRQIVLVTFTRALLA